MTSSSCCPLTHQTTQTRSRHRSDRTGNALSTLLVGVMCLLWVASAIAQTPPSLDLSLDLAAPSDSFNTGPTGLNAALDNLVPTELITLSLTQTATPLVGGGSPTMPRRFILCIGIESVNPIPAAPFDIFLDTGQGGSLAPFFLACPLDSFSDPGAPRFGPAVGSMLPENMLSFTFSLELFGPNAFRGDYVIQAAAEDTAGSPPMVSNPVRLAIEDPEGQNPLQVTSVSILGGLAVGPETGGTTFEINGLNFLAQSDWVRFPPIVLVGGIPATNVRIDSAGQISAETPPTANPTSPPFTEACLTPVTVRRNPQLSPGGSTQLAGFFRYNSGITPTLSQLPTGSSFDPESLQNITLQGTGFLNGARVEITPVSVLAPRNFTIQGVDTLVGPAGTTLSFSLPPLCSGSYNIRVVNCDEAASNTVPLDVDPITPALTSVTPEFTLSTMLFTQGSIPSVLESGSLLTIQGTGFIGPNSPLVQSGASAGNTTEVFIDGVSQGGIGPTSATLISGMTNSGNQNGVLRPALGTKSLGVFNPACVSLVAPPVTNPSGSPCPGLNGQIPGSCRILVQESSGPDLSTGALLPDVAPAAGGSTIVIQGSNFFGIDPASSVQDFTNSANPPGPITLLDPGILRVPAVRIGDQWAPRVEILSTTSLSVTLPPAILLPGQLLPLTVDVNVFNPDLQSSPTTLSFTYVSGLTAGPLMQGGAPTLDENLLRSIALGTSAGNPSPLLADNRLTAAPTIVFAVNPSPSRDQMSDPAAANLPAGTSYDYVFLFNTRTTPPGSAAAPSARAFLFEEINLPETILLDQASIAQAQQFDSTQPNVSAPASTVVVPAMTRIRVIIKAFGYDLSTTNNNLIFESGNNPPLILQSRNNIRVDSLINLSGGAFFPEAFETSSGGPIGGLFRVRVEQTYPPAGAGRGGRGGANFPANASQIPGPNFSAGAVSLRGGAGETPPIRILPGGLSVNSGGEGALGAAPLGVSAGGGGGGGYAIAGANGNPGTSPGAVGGVSYSPLAGATGPLTAGSPVANPYVYGATAADFALFGSSTPGRSVPASDTGYLFGGSGGGGGGGGLALFLPALTLGGRGGNGGGCLALVANRNITVGPSGALLARGEAGQVGVDAFPTINTNPAINVNLPGTGGAGSGGTILAFALGDIRFEPLVGPLPAGLGRVNVLGGPTSPQGSNPLGVTLGGMGSVGRLRLAINNRSGVLADFTARVNALVAGNELLSFPQGYPFTSPSTNFFAWPNM